MNEQNLYPTSKETQQHDLETIKQRLRKIYLSDLPRREILEKALNEMQPEGGYPGLDYEIKPDLYLPSFPHLEYLWLLAVALRHPESPFYDLPEVREKLSRGFDFWLKKNPQTHHIWFHVIGVPLRLSRIMMLFDRDLTPAQRAGGLAMIKYGYRERDGAYMYEQHPGTGTNLVWVARCQVEAGCLEGNYDYAFRAARAIAHEIRIGLDEGLQPDFSFHQHGPMLYIAGYGMAFGADASVVAGLVHGTSLAFPSDKIELLSRFVLDSQQGSIRGKFWDFSVMARNLSFPHGQSAAEVIVGVEALQVAFPARATEAACFAQRLRGEVPPETGVTPGNRHYWRSDYMVHRRSGYLAGVKMVSSRIFGTETGNGQGVKNYYTADGAMCLLKTGAEYFKLMVLWNWRQIPGITCAQSDEPYKLVTWGYGSEGKTTFVGGVSDRRYGAAAFDFDHDGVRGRKSWFFFDDEIVCLGAGIESEVPYPVTTALEQNRHTGKVSARVADEMFPVALGETRDLRGAQWLLHGTTGYFFPESQPVVAQIEKRTGAWRTICQGLPDDPRETDDVFTAWINHGAKPQGGGYAYIVLPETTAEQLDAYAAPVIIVNTPQQQAVWHPCLQRGAAVFYQPGQIALPDGTILSVDKPCALLVVEKDGLLEISLADPNQTEARITVSLAGKETRTINFDLPTEKGWAGQTVTQSLNW
jgi:chondroitin AC lyase